MEYIHSKGYLHIDLKSNNALLEQRNDCFCSVIIDFGKGKLIAKVGWSSSKIWHSKIWPADYIVPEVRNGFKETTAGDIYLLGKMLKQAVFGRSLSNLFSRIISQTTNSSYIDKPSVLELIILLKNIAKQKCSCKICFGMFSWRLCATEITHLTKQIYFSWSFMNQVSY